MKQLFTSLIAIVFANTLFAQSSKKALTQLDEYRVYINYMLQNREKRGVKSNSPIHMESLMAQSTRDNTVDSLRDSVRIFFGFVDTSMYDYNTMIYPYNYPYNTSPMFNNDMGIYTNPRVWFTSYYHWTVDPNTLEYRFFQQESRQFDWRKNLLMDTMLYADSSTIPNMTYFNTYDASNKITAGYAFTYQAGKADSLYKQYFSYSGGLLVKDSTYQLVSATWHLVSKTFYTYNVSSDLVQIDNYANPIDSTFTKPLVEWFQYTNTYDGSHRMLTVYAKQNDGKTLAPYVADTFAYAGPQTFHTSWKEYQYDGINKYWAPISYMTKFLNLSGLPDSINMMSFDSLSNKWVPNIKYIAKYDSLNNPDSLLEYDYSYVSFPSKPDFTTRYYYNYILDPNGINNLAGTNDNIKLYPDPASESITVSGINNAGGNHVVCLTLSDMQGRVYERQYANVKNGKIDFNVSYLTHGSYLLTIQDGAGIMLGRKQFIKE